jgi:C_GCAxxG_C_C family probable redox protein
MIDESIALAKKFFAGKYNCTQSVMKSILLGMKMDFDEIMPLAAGLGAGVAHEGNVCGAVTGAIIALGVIEGKSKTDALEQKEAAYASGEEFIRRFKKIHGTIHCDSLTGIEMRDIEARESASEDGLFERVCPTYLANAVRIALEITIEKKGG